MFTTAISDPDQYVKESDRCCNINVTGTCHFIKEVIKRGCRVLFFSSDAVFGDIPEKIYDENSVTEALTPYSKMKEAIEDKFIEEHSLNLFVCRMQYQQRTVFIPTV